MPPDPSPSSGGRSGSSPPRTDHRLVCAVGTSGDLIEGLEAAGYRVDVVDGAGLAGILESHTPRAVLLESERADLEVAVEALRERGHPDTGLVLVGRNQPLAELRRLRQGIFRQGVTVEEVLRFLGGIGPATASSQNGEAWSTLTLGDERARSLRDGSFPTLEGLRELGEILGDGDDATDGPLRNPPELSPEIDALLRNAAQRVHGVPPDPDGGAEDAAVAVPEEMMRAIEELLDDGPPMTHPRAVEARSEPSEKRGITSPDLSSRLPRPVLMRDGDARDRPTEPPPIEPGEEVTSAGDEQTTPGRKRSRRPSTGRAGPTVRGRSPWADSDGAAASVPLVGSEPHLGSIAPSLRPSGAPRDWLRERYGVDRQSPRYRKWDSLASKGTEIPPTRHRTDLGAADDLVVPDSAEARLEDPLTLLGASVAGRQTGALELRDRVDGPRRWIVLREGDLTHVSSEHPAESLAAFLLERGDLGSARLKSLKLPASGRHAAAALIARGYLGQDDLWPVLRAHAEWILSRQLRFHRVLGRLERSPHERLLGEPNVFGGAAGAEVLVDAARRVLTPEMALGRLGGADVRLTEGGHHQLLSESALDEEERAWLRRAERESVAILSKEEPGLIAVVAALAALDVFDVHLASRAQPARPSEGPAAAHDLLDAEATRERIRARMALVEEGDYFSLLGVSTEATSYEIKRAFLDLRRTFAPGRLLTAETADLASEAELICEVLEEAYDVLRHPHRRERYRRALFAIPS